MINVEAYARPGSVHEALDLLRARGDAAAIIAGGTDLVLEHRPSLRCLVDVTGLGLDYIRTGPRGITLGATTTMEEIVRSPHLAGLADGVLCAAAGMCGSWQVRNLATVGGNVANALPAADTPPALLALDARVRWVGAGEREMPLESFFTGPRKTVLARGDLLTELVIPPAPQGLRGAFIKFGRTQKDIAIVNVAVAVLPEGGRCRMARIALDAVAPTPIRVPEAERLLETRGLGDAVLDEAAGIVSRAVRPISDHRAGAEYRRRLSGILVRRALVSCLDGARGARRP
jgi:carbon-monoxide dehydrogenase medium subunit